MLLNTTGCHLNLLITGRGHTCGTGIAPTIKITANPRVYERMKDDIDFGAGEALTGAKTMEQLVTELDDLVIAVCRGKKPHADRLGHRENEIWSIPQSCSC